MRQSETVPLKTARKGLLLMLDLAHQCSFESSCIPFGQNAEYIPQLVES